MGTAKSTKTDPAKDEKKNEGSLDSLSIGYMLRAIKGVIRWGLNRMRTSRPQPWLTLAWVYLQAPKTIVESLEGGFRLTTVVAEKILDKLPLPHVVNDVLEATFGDLPNEVRNYFDALKGEITFPEGFEPLTIESAGAFAQSIKQFLMGEARMKIEEMLNRLNLLAPFKAGKVMRFYHTLLGLPLLKDGRDPVEVFEVLYKALRPSDRKDILRVIEFFDEPDELPALLEQPLDRQKFLVRLALVARSQVLWRQMLQWSKDNLPEFEQNVHEALGQAHVWLRGVHRDFSTDNLNRRIEILEARYDPKNLDKKPWIREELPDGDPERARPKDTSHRRWIPVLGWVFVFLCAIAGLYGYYNVRLMDAAPAVVIVDPPQGAYTTPPKIEGQAEDDRGIVSVEAQVNNGRKYRVFIFPGSRVNFTWTPKDCQIGMNRVQIHVRGGSGKTTDEFVQFILKREDTPAPQGEPSDPSAARPNPEGV